MATQTPSRPRLEFVNSPAIRYFFAVAEAGSFRGASDQIGVAVSAIHRQIGLLEKQLKIELLIRGRGRAGVKLTSAGELLLYRVRIAFNQVGVALQEIETIRGGAISGKVVMGTTDVLALDIFRRFLAGFYAQFPNISVELHVLDRRRLIEALIDNQLDAALSFDLPVRFDLRTLAEFKLTSCAIVPVDHPLAGKERTSLGECAQYPLTMPIEGDNLGGILGQMQSASRIRPNVVLSINSFAMMREVVADKLAISIHTRLPGAFANHDPRLVYIPIKDAIARYSVLSCAVPGGRQLRPEASLFIAQLLAEIEEQMRSQSG